MRIIKNFKASSYSGEYDHTISGFRFVGSLQFNSGKQLTDINGQILESGLIVASFSSWLQDKEMHTTINDIYISRAAEIGEAVGSIIEAIKADVEEEEK